MEKKISVSKYIPELIIQSGVKVVPVLQGGGIMKVIDEIALHPILQYVCPYHEQALAMMVDGYARIHGFCVGLVTSGPGGTNLVTGIASAYYDSIPCLFITGQVGMYHLKKDRAVRQRGFQETDIVSIVKPITKYAVTIENSQDIRYIFEQAVFIAKSGRPGPVLLDLPYNVQRDLIDPAQLRSFTPPLIEENKLREIKTSIIQLLEKLKESKKPAIYVGGGIQIAQQVDVINKIAKELRIPSASTWAGADVFAYTNPLYLGNTGRNGNPSANALIQNCDLLLALGTRFTTKNIMSEKEFAKNATIVTVDVDEGELKDGLINSHLKIHADLKPFLTILYRTLKEQSITFNPNHSFWLEETSKLKKNCYKIDITQDSTNSYVSPYIFMDILSEELSRNAIIASDTGCTLLFSLQGYKPKSGQRFLSDWGHSSMGWALPAALGVYYALEDRSRQLIVIIGDGGFQMNIQELQTIFFNRIPVKIFVFNNDCYANIKFPSKSQFDGRYFATDPSGGYKAPDFVKIGTAYGINSFRIENTDNIRQKIREVLDEDGPVLVDLNIDPEQYVFEV